MDIVKAIRSRMDDQPERRAIEFRAHWYSWGDVACVRDQIEKLLREDDVADGTPIGVVVRNRIGQAASLLGLFASNRSIRMLYAYQPAEVLASDIERSQLPAVIASEQDWTPDTIASARRAGSLAIALSDEGRVTRVDGLHAAKSKGTGEQPVQEPSLQLLSSGTTGKPKNVVMPFKILRRAVISAALGSDNPDDPPPQIISWPFSGVGGTCQLMACAVTGTPFVLLEKFAVETFVEAIKRTQPSWISVTPAALRMILAAEIPPADLASVKAVFGGSAKLEPEVQERFEEVYGCTVYWAYGATEFCGTIITWTVGLRREFGDSKRGSIGRVMDGIKIRVVDPQTGAEVGPGAAGLLHAIVPELGPDWIKTTDLVPVDADGFVFHHGRNDGAIVRGGFKILPDTVVDVLRNHPLGADASVLGVPDTRLGQLPVAAIEVYPGRERPTAADLEAFIRKNLPPTHVPVAWRFVDALPRTSSMKVSLTDVVKLFDAAS
jgi:long-chain acyl-CoA synthetase